MLLLLWIFCKMRSTSALPKCGMIAEQGYHVAMGYKIHEKDDINMNTLILGAESKMYKDKTDYYKHHDRRAR